MKGGALPQGYTIVEVMIFLAVSAALFVMVAMTFSRQQGRTQFSVAARDVESQVRDILNDVASGFYARTADFPCRRTGTGLQFTGLSAAQGANPECIFLGRVIHFNPAGASSDYYNIYTVAGARQYIQGGSLVNVDSYDNALPRAVAQLTSQTGPDITEAITLPGGIRLARMVEASTGNTVQAVGVLTRLDASAASASPGSISVDLLPLVASASATSSKDQMLGVIQAIGSTSPKNPQGGVLACFNSGSSNQHAILQIGGQGRDFSTDLQIRENTCPGTLTF